MALVATGARLRVAPAILDGIGSNFPAAARAITDGVHAQDAPAQLKRLYLQRYQENDPDVLYGDFFACDQFDRRADVGRIAAPTLVVCGDADQMTPPKFSEYLAQTLPNARLALIPHVGHMVALEAPDQVTAAVEAFLRTLD
jgi:pimeloyl-ACP methyl ester carboxylesterase